MSEICPIDVYMLHLKFQCHLQYHAAAFLQIW